MTARFVRPFNVVGLAEMSDASKAGIFETILGDFLASFTPEISALCSGLVQSTIDTFNNVVSSLLPTPAKSHYTFNLRDLAKVFQGTLMGSPKFIEQPIGMVRTRRLFSRFPNFKFGKMASAWSHVTVEPS